MRDAAEPTEREITQLRELLARIRAGDREAAWELVESYEKPLLRIVRRRLPQDLRQKFDSQDFVQAAWASLFARPSRLLELNAPDEFVAYAATVAANKVVQEIRRYMHAEKRNIRREAALPDDAPVPQPAAASRSPTPSATAIARERWDRIVDGLPEHYRRMLELRFAGYTFEEIGSELGYDERTIRRALRKILRDQQQRDPW